jgi:hypothetical protein
MWTRASWEGKKLEDQGTNTRPWVLVEKITANILAKISVTKCRKREVKARNWSVTWL